MRLLYSEFKIYKEEIEKHGVKNAYRYFFRWRKGVRPGGSSVKDEQPWITYQAIDALKSRLKPSHKVFEYGGGGSTLFFTNRVAEVVTVEHNEEWFKILTDTLHKKNIKSWTGKFIPAGNGNVVVNADKAEPSHYSSGDEQSKGLNYKNYATAIDAYANAYFDCVVVDGRSRPACIIHAIPKLKKGGLLVLDNSDRDYYLQKTGEILKDKFRKVVHTYGPSPYSTEFTKTSIWEKK